MFNKSTTIAVALALVGCTASQPTMQWSRPDATQQSYAADSFQCAQTARATAPGGGFAMGGLAFVLIAAAVNAQNTHNTQQQVYNECMGALGYTGLPVVAAQ